MIVKLIIHITQDTYIIIYYLMKVYVHVFTDELWKQYFIIFFLTQRKYNWQIKDFITLLFLVDRENSTQPLKELKHVHIHHDGGNSILTTVIRRVAERNGRKKERKRASEKL